MIGSLLKGLFGGPEDYKVVQDGQPLGIEDGVTKREAKEWAGEAQRLRPGSDVRVVHKDELKDGR